jgi:hypothetical protein
MAGSPDRRLHRDQAISMASKRRLHRVEDAEERQSLGFQTVLFRLGDRGGTHRGSI